MFHINAKSLLPLEAFPYLRRTIVHNNSNCPVVYQNLKKVQSRWGVIVRFLEKMGATVRARGMMYKAVDQSVLLYGSDSWVVMGVMLKFL